MLQVYISLCLKSMIRHIRSLCSAIPSLPNECRRRLETELAKPERAADDWSIPFIGCGCADCAHLAGFPTSSEQRSLTWPLTKQRRQAIYHCIDSQGLPVTHTTERTGSPHKLKLHKTNLLMKEDSALRKCCTGQLAWVRGLN